MCVIVDANRAAAVVDPAETRYGPLRRWIEERGGKLVHGGLLTAELAEVEQFRRWLVQLERAGRAFRADDPAVRAETALVSTLPIRSDDPHVLALARVSGARTVCTEDALLMRDFKDRALVPRPKGRVYRTEAHIGTLCHCRGCPGR